MSVFLDNTGFLRVGWFITFMLVGVAAFIVVVGWGAIAVDKHYSRVNCEQFGKQSNREVRFVFYNYFNWDCLTPTAEGKWISTSALREFGEAP